VSGWNVLAFAIVGLGLLVFLYRLKAAGVLHVLHTFRTEPLNAFIVGLLLTAMIITAVRSAYVHPGSLDVSLTISTYIFAFFLIVVINRIQNEELVVRRAKTLHKFNCPYCLAPIQPGQGSALANAGRAPGEPQIPDFLCPSCGEVLPNGLVDALRNAAPQPQPEPIHRHSEQPPPEP
jgi:hypothetical protein